MNAVGETVYFKHEISRNTQKLCEKDNRIFFVFFVGISNNSIFVIYQWNIFLTIQWIIGLVMYLPFLNVCHRVNAARRLL